MEGNAGILSKAGTAFSSLLWFTSLQTNFDSYVWYLPFKNIYMYNNIHKKL